MKRTELTRTAGLRRLKRKHLDVGTAAQRARFHDTARAQRVCAVTRVIGPWQAHHVIEAQEIKRRGGDIWDPRNALRLSVRAHERHTLAVRRVKLTELRDENLEFAFELMGAAAYVYLTRMYAGFDLRVELLLAELEA